MWRNVRSPSAPERRIGTTVNRNRMEREGALERAARPNLHVGRLAYCKAPTYAITSLIEVACTVAKVRIEFNCSKSETRLTSAFNRRDRL